MLSIYTSIESLYHPAHSLMKDVRSCLQNILFSLESTRDNNSPDQIVLMHRLV